MIEKLTPAHDGVHKWVAEFTNGRKTRFGAKGYTDWTEGATIQQRKMYRSRHRKDLQTHDPYRAGYLSYYILWGESRSRDENLRRFNQRFF